MGVLLILHEQVHFGPEEAAVLASLFDQSPPTTSAAFLPRFFVLGLPTRGWFGRFAFGHFPDISGHVGGSHASVMDCAGGLQTNGVGNRSPGHGAPQEVMYPPSSHGIVGKWCSSRDLECAMAKP